MIRPTVHAERRLWERAIPLAWVEATIAKPDRVEFEQDRVVTWSFRAFAEAGGRTLKVVSRPDRDDILVNTADLDRGARR